MNSRTLINAVNVTIGISLFLSLLSLAYSEDGNGRVEVDPVRKETRNGQSVQMALHQNASTSNLTSTMNDRDGGMDGSSESLEVDGVTGRKNISEVHQESTRRQRMGRNEKLTYRQWIRISRCRNNNRLRGKNFVRRCRRKKGLHKRKLQHQTTINPPYQKKGDAEIRSAFPSRKHDHIEMKNNSNRSNQMSGPQLKEKQKSSSSYVDESSHRDHSMNPKKSCPTCQLSEEEIVELKIAQFKELLLEKLRLTEEDLKFEPKEGIRQRIPKFPSALLDNVMRDNAGEENADDFYAHDKKLFFSGEDLRRNCIKSRKVTGCYLFELEGKGDAQVTSAQLWFYKSPDANDMQGQTIRVFQLGKTRKGVIRNQNLMHRQDIHNRQGWISVDVLKHAVNWSKKRMKTIMVGIFCENCQTRHYRSLYGAKAGHRPVLAIGYKDKIYSRRKRQTNNCTNTSSFCCKRELQIHFSRQNMNLIVQPLNLDIGYCRGHCADPINLYNRSRNTWAQNPTLRDSGSYQIQPCCVPETFRATTIIRRHQNTNIFEEIIVPDLVVEMCGCSV